MTGCFELIVSSDIVDWLILVDMSFVGLVASIFLIVVEILLEEPSVYLKKEEK